MNVTKFQGLVYGTVLGTALLAVPALSSAQDASTTTVTCNDGTSSHGGRGACSGHGGVNKSAAVAGQQAAQSLRRQRPRPQHPRPQHPLLPRHLPPPAAAR